MDLAQGPQIMSRGSLSWDEYRAVHQKLWKRPPAIRAPGKPEKAHKYFAKKVTIDGIIFPSKLEGRLYVALSWQWKANLITEPLRQVCFSLGIWLPLGAKKPEELFYIADFVVIDLQTGELRVCEAKGKETDRYLKIREVFPRIYGFCITEYKDKDL